jgi:hypothetical protein
MDIRLTIDGGASPQAPPGKAIESPPPREEFEKTLHTAKKEETPGEVAEKEPNAHSQKLDSEKKENETKDSASSAATTVTPSTPIQIDPRILMQLLQVGLVQLPLVLPTKVSVASTNLQLEVPTESPKVALTDLKTPELVHALAIVEGNPTLQPADSPKSKGQALTIAPSFTMPVGKGTDQRLNGLTQTVREAIEPIKQTLVSPQQNLELNLTSVKASSNEVLVQVAATKATPELVVKQDSKLPVQLENATQEKGSVVTSKIILDNAESLLNKDSKSDQDAKSKDQSNSASGLIQDSKPTQATDAAQAPVSNTPHKFTTAERQMMVDSISKKIDELAAKSVRNEVRVEMQPPNLGSVVVNIRKDMTGLTATLNASNEPLRQALHESRNDLAGTLATKNVGQVRIEVRGANADTMNMGQQFSQTSSHDQHQQHQTRHKLHSNSQLFSEKQAAEQPIAAQRSKTTLLDLEI